VTRLVGVAARLGVGGLVRLLQLLLFNPVGLRGWLWLLSGRVEFFGNSHALGEMVTTVDYYLKRKLDRPSQVVSVYLVNKPHLANAYLAMLQARAFGGPRIRFVRNRVLCQVLAPLEHQLFYTGLHRTYSPHPPEYDALTDRYNFHLERQVTAAERQRARALLERLGLPREAPFVCVHVREGAFSARVLPPGHNALRNADIMTYRAAIDYLVRQGFWVVRMGEATLTPLPPMDHVIDNARSPYKSAFLDIALVADCAFYVGSSSGLANVAAIFNKCLLIANVVPLETAGWGWGARTLWIPKLIYSTPERRYLTYPEIVSRGTGTFRRMQSYILYPEIAARGIGAFHRMQSYIAAQLEIHDNSPEDILEATQELYRWSQGAAYTEEEARAQRAFAALLPPDYYSHGAHARVCASFIRRHPDLMPAASAAVPDLSEAVASPWT